MQNDCNRKQERNVSDFGNDNVLAKRPLLQEWHRISFRPCRGIYMLSAVTHYVSVDPGKMQHCSSDGLGSSNDTQDILYHSNSHTPHTPTSLTHTTLSSVTHLLSNYWERNNKR